jgi:hypothetical protein
MTKATDFCLAMDREIEYEQGKRIYSFKEFDEQVSQVLRKIAQNAGSLTETTVTTLLRDFNGFMQMRLLWVLSSELHYSWFCIKDLIQGRMLTLYAGMAKDSLSHDLMAFAISTKRIPANLFITLQYTGAEG